MMQKESSSEAPRFLGFGAETRKEAFMGRSRKILFAVAVFLGAIGLLGSQSQPPDPTPADLLRSFRSLHVVSKTVYIKKGVTEGAILKELQKRQLDLDIAIKTDSSAETILTIERQGVWPQWDYSYRLDHQTSGIVLAAGKVKAIDGGSAAKQIAEQIVKRIGDVRNSTGKK
jgi:hypothetical protein